MTDQTDLMIRVARAIDASRTADEYAQAADEAKDTPGNAARNCWDASTLLRAVGEKFIDLAEQSKFAAMRYERAQREEQLTGREYRAGDAA